ncbi:hypothetical protein D3C86_993530 [compost metagenome]
MGVDCDGLIWQPWCIDVLDSLFRGSNASTDPPLTGVVFIFLDTRADDESGQPFEAIERLDASEHGKLLRVDGCHLQRDGEFPAAMRRIGPLDHIVIG